MFLSQRPNNDPQPWQSVFADHVRSSTNNAWDRAYKPRPEFTQTRDPEPWLMKPGNSALVRKAEHPGKGGPWLWSPRHEEFDTPVNPYLEIFRRQLEEKLDEGSYDLVSFAQVWLYDGMEPEDIDWLGFTRDQFDHAHRVLTLLATLSN